MRSRQATAVAAVLTLVVVFAGCSSGGSDSSSSETKTTTSTKGSKDRPASIDSFTVPDKANCSTSPGRVEVEWTTSHINEVTLLVNGKRVASGPYPDGNDAVVVTCNGKPAQIRIDGTNGVGSATKIARTNTSGGGTAPKVCGDSSALNSAAATAYNDHITAKVPGVTIFSIRCVTATGDVPGEYALVTLATQTASGRFRVLVVAPPGTPGQASPIGFDTEEGSPPGFTYTSCGLDPEALAALGLPKLAPSGDADTKNCPIKG